MTLRTRFAPSPTGAFHIGSARTALYCYLHALQTGGKFLLRIEDTDRLRSTDVSVQVILDAMKWLGLDWHEGPIFQSERMERYQTVAQSLIEQRLAYRCTCSSERLEQLRETQIQNKLKPRYDGHCRDLNHPAQGSYVLRFANPLEGSVRVEDLVHGEVEVLNSELDDLIIQRSDGSPTYNFCVVIDDWDMQVSHVIRGDDHLNNTPRQINILKALKVTTLPHYAHVPMILGADGKRLSKRHGAVSVLEYEKEGFLPHALLNYLVRLGWSHGDQEIFSREELLQYFDIHKINKAPAAFDRDKLLWLNAHYIKTSEPKALLAAFEAQLRSLQLDLAAGPERLALIEIQQGRVHTLQEMALKSRYFFEDIELEALPGYSLDAKASNCLHLLKAGLDALDEWRAPALQASIKASLKQHGYKLGQLGPVIRYCITGQTASPPLDQTLELLGRERSCARIEQGLAVLGA